MRKGFVHAAAGLALAATLMALAAGHTSSSRAALPAAAPTGTAAVFDLQISPVAPGTPTASPVAPSSPTAAPTIAAPQAGHAPRRGPKTTASSSATVAPTGTVPPSPTVTATATIRPTSTIPPTAVSLVFNTPMPTAAPQPLTFGALDHAVIYDNGAEMILTHTDGKNRAGLSFLSPNSHMHPAFSGGWQYVYYNNGFWLGDVFGHQQPIAPPATAGEQVFDAIPSPDGRYIAWQLVTPALIDGLVVNTGASRIVITDPLGGNARTILQQTHGATYGDIPLLYGWRPGHPPTLLVQTNYAIPSMLGLHRGLEEFDPAVGDMVNDYLPPLGNDTLPQGEVLGVSPGGNTIAYATASANLPSGEGPFPTNLLVMTTNGRHITVIDSATGHKGKATAHLPAPRASIFYREAFISPDDSRIAYTRLEILYPKGVIKPYIQPIACLANLDGSGKVDFGQDERVMGWADNHTVVVRRENSRVNGLYAVDLDTGKTARMILGNNLWLDGVVP